MTETNEQLRARLANLDHKLVDPPDYDSDTPEHRGKLHQVWAKRADSDGE